MVYPASVMLPRPWHFEIRNIDVVDFLESLPDESVDLFVTDPAYPSLEKHRAVGTTTRLTQSWFPVITDPKTWQHVFRLMYGVLKPDRHAYIMCDQETYRDWWPMLERAGFTLWKGLIWTKPGIGMGYHYRGQHEMIIFAEKGKRKLADLGISDVLPARMNAGERTGYPTQKPAALGEILVRQSARKGELVCDPFCGSGSFGIGALTHQCAFLGADLQLAACALATCRLSLLGTQATFTLRGQPRLF